MKILLLSLQVDVCGCFCRLLCERFPDEAVLSSRLKFNFPHSRSDPFRHVHVAARQANPSRASVSSCLCFFARNCNMSLLSPAQVGRPVWRPSCASQTGADRLPLARKRVGRQTSARQLARAHSILTHHHLSECVSHTIVARPIESRLPGVCLGGWLGSGPT